MTQRIASIDIGTDPFKDGTFNIISIDNHELVDQGDIYHKKSKIKFLKEESQDVNQLIPTDIITYTNSTLLKVIAAESTNILNTAGTPTYEIKTIYNSERQGDLLDELQTPLFYTDSDAALGIRNIVLDSSTPLVGSPEPDLSRISYYNSIYMTFPDEQQGNLVKYLKGAFSIFERFMVLAGQYSDSINNLSNTNVFTLDALIQNFDFPFPTDAYYLFNNEDKELDFSNLEQIIFAQIKKTVSKNTLWYNDINSEEDTSSEYLFFRVEKWFSNTTEGTPDQVFFIPATDSNKLFIDTQIMQNMPYSYRITSYYATIGQEYFFSDISINGDNTGECVVQVRPAIQISSENVIEQRLINVPPPPLSPFVSFHNKTSTGGKIKIYLESQKGQQIEAPIQISFQNNIIGSNWFLPDETVQYQYFKQGAKFKAYRVSIMPESYEDFSEGLIGTFENTDMSDNMIVMDTITPNKKYYYMFRSFNNYGSYSNPSPVYEVELIKDADDARVVINSILIRDIIDDIDFKKDIKFRSLLNINVADQQTNFILDNVREPDDSILSFVNQLTNVSLGSDFNGAIPYKVWGNKFKFRIKSVDSGKIIDFNIKVNLTAELSEAQQEAIEAIQSAIAAGIPTGPGI